MTTSVDRVEEVARDVLGAATDSLVQVRDRPKIPGLLTRMLVSDRAEAAEDAAALLRDSRAARSALLSYLRILLACDAKYASRAGEGTARRGGDPSLRGDLAVTRAEVEAGFVDTELVARARIMICAAERGPADRAALSNFLADHAGHLLALAHAAIKIQEAYRRLPSGTDFHAAATSLGGTTLSVVQDLDRLEDRARRLAERDLKDSGEVEADASTVRPI